MSTIEIVVPDVRRAGVPEVSSWCDEVLAVVDESYDLAVVQTFHTRFAGFAAAYSKLATKRAGINKVERTNRRIEQRLGELILDARAAGDMNAKGGAYVEGSTLDDLGLDRHDAAEFVAMAENNDAVEQVLNGSSDASPPTRNKVRVAVNERRREQGREHPAVFSRPIMDVAVHLLGAPRRILDPFAGTGLVHVVADRLGADSIGVEIEPEWATMHERTVVGDSTHLTRTLVGRFDAVFTSPTYGNRMADHHEARDESDRLTYRHRLGRPLDDRNTGAMQWGPEYRALHNAVWAKTVQLLDVGGVFVINVKDHVRDGEVQDVAAWHVQALIDWGLRLDAERILPTNGRGDAGDNGAARVGFERLYRLTKFT